MPVFAKGLMCSRSGSRTESRRPGCRGSSSSDDDALEVVGGPNSRNNTEFETQRGGREIGSEDDDGFKFFLTVADPQPAEDLPVLPETVVPASLEFEHADAPTSVAEEPPPPPPSKKPAKRAAAKSSCGKATSDEEEASAEDDTAQETSEPAGTQETPEPSASEMETVLASGQPPEDGDFLVLLTGLLAQGPPPPDDFRFFLTVHQAEAAT